MHEHYLRAEISNEEENDQQIPDTNSVQCPTQESSSGLPQPDEGNESNCSNPGSKVNRDCTEMKVRTRAQRLRSNTGCSTNTSGVECKKRANSDVSLRIEEKETYLLHHGIIVQQCSWQEYMVHISRSTSFQGYDSHDNDNPERFQTYRN